MGRADAANHDPRDEDRLKQRKLSLMGVVACLYVAACLLPAFWGRGGFLEGGTELPGWFLIIGLPPFCCSGLPSTLATIVSGRWLWQNKYREASALACLNLFAPLYWLSQTEPGRFVLRKGFYVWSIALVVWAAGVVVISLLDRTDHRLIVPDTWPIDEP